MAKVSIITRAMNRLEYTVLCVREIYDKAGMDDYEHIIINQNSSDGTKEWLDSLLYEKYYKLKVLHNKENSGDAGGMKDGFDIISNDTEYVMQFDNDCYPLTQNFLKYMVDIMDTNPKIGALMCKREGVGTILTPTNIRNINNIKCGNIPIGTCCIMFRRKDLEKINYWVKKEKIGWAQTICKNLTMFGKEVLKILDIKVMHTDGTHKQAIKYKKYFTSKTEKNSNFRDINYGVKNDTSR